ncbi:hypothetical protein QEN19_001751 [Hanseniaspora menglaensis]
MFLTTYLARTKVLRTSLTFHGHINYNIRTIPQSLFHLYQHSKYTTAHFSKNKELPLKHIPLLFEIKILHLLSGSHNKSYDNLAEIINIISSKDKVINGNLLNNIVDYIMKEYELKNDSILLFKLNTILKEVLTKYFKEEKQLLTVPSYETPLLNETKILKIVSLFNKIPVSKINENKIYDILYETVPLIYTFYYQNYTAIKNYKYGNDLNNEDITSFIKLPLLSDTQMLRSISKDNHMLVNGIDIIKMNTLSNNYNNKGAGNFNYASLKFGIFKTGIKNHFTRVNYLPHELKKDDADITLTFTDKYHVLKQFTNHKIFLNLQLYQIELIVKRLYLFIGGNTDAVDDKICLTVMNQFFNHIDSFINLDPHQYQSKNQYSNSLLNSINVSDFPHLHHLISNNKTFIKNLVHKQLFYKVVKRKLIDRKIKYYNFKEIDDANLECIVNNLVIDSMKDQEKFIPYRRISRKKRCAKSTNYLKTIHHYCINYFPTYLLKVYKRDEEIAVKVFTSFSKGYLERRRIYKNKHIPVLRPKKKSTKMLLDPIKAQRFEFNKIFDPYNTQSVNISEKMFIPRNLTLLKLYLKFVYMNLNDQLIVDRNSTKELIYLTEKVYLLQNFQDDHVFAVVKADPEAIEEEPVDEATKSNLLVKKLLFQLCGE